MTGWAVFHQCDSPTAAVPMVQSADETAMHLAPGTKCI
jgi:hypothetical protein